MRPVVIAFVLGAVAVAVAVSVAGIVLGIAAQSGEWDSFRIALGPVVFLSYERLSDGSSTAFGSGLAVLALAEAP